MGERGCVFGTPGSGDRGGRAGRAGSSGPWDEPLLIKNVSDTGLPASKPARKTRSGCSLQQPAPTKTFAASPNESPPAKVLYKRAAPKKTVKTIKTIASAVTTNGAQRTPRRLYRWQPRARGAWSKVTETWKEYVDDANPETMAGTHSVTGFGGPGGQFVPALADSQSIPTSLQAVLATIEIESKHLINKWAHIDKEMKTYIAKCGPNMSGAAGIDKPKWYVEYLGMH
ncbi:hypothetical protein BDK51DRAFT_45199 [Blyttiomyces helicus]|uniref:Uncharacterized protein n=1 Tax=Blyttiomyces helicus TaxID=388810 RepID=A0A4P9WDD1_9FUNG|nr:hypothetical protein BDK51DRAFT_45199 [Blyttiomyces helicus]|eukprot:RKO90691.1 hypothetical protein BDK51DRAFT_45199 [Blyttiomyces helicus]